MLSTNWIFWSNKISHDELNQFYEFSDCVGIQINGRGLAVLTSSIKYAVASILNVRIKKINSNKTHNSQRRV